MRPNARPGVALLSVVFLMSILSALMTMVALQIVGTHKFLRQREDRVQAKWLARAGVEVAVEHLLTSADGKLPDKLDFLAEGAVHLKVDREKDSTDVYRVTSEARFPDEVRGQKSTLGRRLRRVVDGKEVRIEMLSD